MVLSQKLSELESALSATPVEVTELIDTLKGEVSSEGGKDMVTRLESLLNKDRQMLGRRSDASRRATMAGRAMGRQEERRTNFTNLNLNASGPVLTLLQ